MHYYLIIFSDWSETVGKQTSRTAMERDARIYCEKWNLSETVREVREITPEEYSRRTGQPIKKEKKPEKKSNRIPRAFYRITARQLVESSGGKAGDVWHIYRNERGLLGLNTTTGKYYCLFASHLRNPDLYEFLSVDKPEKAQDGPETIKTEEDTTKPMAAQKKPENGPTSPATVSDKEKTTEATEAPKREARRLVAWRVECRKIGGDWTTYSQDQPTREDAERIQEEAETRRTVSTDGETIIYRIA